MANDRLEDVEEIAPASKSGKLGEAVHGGDRAGPNSDQAGKVQAPQKGNPPGQRRGS